MENKRLMALDVGSKTVGVAVSDLLGITAQPVKTIRRTSLQNDLLELATLVSQYEPDRLIVGLPFNMNGSEGASAQAARDFGEAAANEFGLEVIYQDERLTTVSAQRVLLEGNVSRKRRKEVIDTVAAVFILENYLAKNNY